MACTITGAGSPSTTHRSRRSGLDAQAWLIFVADAVLASARGDDELVARRS